MDLWLWFAFYPHTWAALVTVLAAGLAFNVAHALGNFVLALVAGPELGVSSTGTGGRADGGGVGVRTLAALLATQSSRRLAAGATGPVAGPRHFSPAGRARAAASPSRGGRRTRR